MMRRLFAYVIFAHVVASYCAMGFYFGDNYGVTPLPFGGVLAPIFVLQDYLKATFRWASLGIDSREELAWYWLAYLIPFAAVLALTIRRSQRKKLRS